MSNEYALRRWFTIETSLAEERGTRARENMSLMRGAARRPSAVAASGRPLQT